MNYHHLYYFFTIAKQGSITKACDVLHISQPALSAQLKQFEHVLKRQLFERHKKRLRLTEDGKMVLDYAQRILTWESSYRIPCGIARRAVVWVFRSAL